jgi:CRP/FNR family transcriptional regulator, cyclic AMP receptor protein
MTTNLMPPSEPDGGGKRAMLGGHHLFGKLAPQHIDRLSACLVTVMAKRGTNLFAKGDPGNCLCAIGAGAVKIGAPMDDGKNGMYNVLRKGDVFGEAALLDGSRRTADAIAVTDCELYVLHRRDFMRLMGDEPEIAFRLIEILCSHLRRTIEQGEEIMFLDLPNRLAGALMRLADADTSGMQERKISIPQRDLGNMVGMSRESTNRQLRIWEDRKWVRLERNAVVILAPDRLAAIADYGTEKA